MPYREVLFRKLSAQNFETSCPCKLPCRFKTISAFGPHSLYRTCRVILPICCPRLVFIYHSRLKAAACLQFAGVRFRHDPGPGTWLWGSAIAENLGVFWLRVLFQVFRASGRQDMWDFPKNGSTLLWGPYTKDPTI